MIKKIILGLLIGGAAVGCTSTCKCGCPYCCGNQSGIIDYSNPNNKPTSDMPIWWDNNKTEKEYYE